MMWIRIQVKKYQSKSMGTRIKIISYFFGSIIIFMEKRCEEFGFFPIFGRVLIRLFQRGRSKIRMMDLHQAVSSTLG